jgi:hypothetical protein
MMHKTAAQFIGPPPRARRPSAPWPGAAVICGLLALPGCAHQQGKPDTAALTALEARLPGRYDNAAQVRADAQSGAVPAHAALDLLIAPADAALIGKAAYYVRETPAGEPHRVLSQYIWVFGRTVEVHSKEAHGGDVKGQEEHLEQHIYQFKEPQRWLQAGDQPELLRSLLPEDLQRLTGCELVWTKKDADFLAERRSTTCSPSAKSAGQLLEQRMELRDNQLSVLAQQIGPEGLSDAPAGQSDPYYRFVRRGAAN